MDNVSIYWLYCLSQLHMISLIVFAVSIGIIITVTYLKLFNVIQNKNTELVNKVFFISVVIFCISVLLVTLLPDREFVDTLLARDVVNRLNQ